ncbi:flagellar brake protein [Paenibacillus brasilensis]|uniref:C-di-GMP-binding flagellar brake protein YcgR n=1 Tax=Paenibacillus brasilensis TaxID=128574 RepID=A0ABU0KRI1_9BACL|nr:flagellar brake domain-containing protein [Paenibacillus brasilensis]MDQ0492037.1 c-di-GMP-binding flagellar brake protein YcgR [Paenibacillus brasilensis]
MFPKINDVLYIQVAGNDHKDELFEFKSRIAEEDSQNFLIEIPMSQTSGHLKKLFLGEELSIFFMSEGGIKNYFNTHVTGFKEDVLRMVRIQKPEPDSISKIQRRNYLRVKANLEIAVKYGVNESRFVAETHDVGGGGVSFQTQEAQQLEEGESLSCWILVPYKNGTLEHVSFQSEVVRIQEMENGRRLIMLKYEKIADQERQKLIKYCFEKQLEFRERA